MPIFGRLFFSNFPIKWEFVFQWKSFAGTLKSPCENGQILQS